MRLHQHLLKTRQDRGVKAQRRKVKGRATLVENTHHDAFAMHDGHGGHAQVNLFALNTKLDAAILWQASLSNVKTGHDLDARNNCR